MYFLPAANVPELLINASLSARERSCIHADQLAVINNNQDITIEDGMNIQMRNNYYNELADDNEDTDDDETVDTVQSKEQAIVVAEEAEEEKEELEDLPELEVLPEPAR